jgi:hypothetical protein
MTAECPACFPAQTPWPADRIWVVYDSQTSSLRVLKYELADRKCWLWPYLDNPDEIKVTAE